MNQLAVTLANLVLILENDGPFYKAYLHSTNLAEGRREAIREGLRKQDLQTRLICVDAPMREQLRRYLDDIWNLIPARHATDSALAHAPTLEFWKDTVQYPEKYLEKYAQTQVCEDLTNANLSLRADIAGITQAIDKMADRPTTNSSKEDLMNAIITITTKTLVNGIDVATMEDAAVYELIAAQEAKIKDLDKIEAKPKKLVAEIEKRRAGIAALVEYLDSKE